MSTPVAFANGAEMSRADTSRLNCYLLMSNTSFSSIHRGIRPRRHSIFDIQTVLTRSSKGDEATVLVVRAVVAGFLGTWALGSRSRLCQKCNVFDHRESVAHSGLTRRKLRVGRLGREEVFVVSSPLNVDDEMINKPSIPMTTPPLAHKVSTRRPRFFGMQYAPVSGFGMRPVSADSRLSQQRTSFRLGHAQFWEDATLSTGPCSTLSREDNHLNLVGLHYPTFSG
ncbi:hypothetical protein C8Q74DRAFT_534447 [Fomes fomentarius]|nr:hypothetical protein C8Q74DRAFT_534447 [Fomes fomentarius]